MYRPDRIESLDIFRFLTVSLALLWHGLQFLRENPTPSGDVMLALRTLTRTATPALMILFGIMLELVYARRARVDAHGAAHSILYRALICYLCYLALVVIALGFGHISTAHAVKAVFFLQPSPFANIFKIYALLLPLAIVVIRLRLRMGLVGPWLIVAAVWLLDLAVIRQMPAPIPSRLTHLLAFLFGLGDLWGPSILHGLTLVSAGMTIGAALFSQRTPGGSGNKRALTLITLSSIAILAVTAHLSGLREMLMQIVDFKAWRSHNHIGYYAYGLVAALMLIALSRTVCALSPPAANRVMVRLGGATLPYFFIGNAILLVLPFPGFLPPFGKFLFLVVFLTVSGSATLMWLQGRGRARLAVQWSASRLLFWKEKEESQRTDSLKAAAHPSR